jgi:dihydropteroate synthase
MNSGRQWRLRTRSLSLAKPLIMGVINVTPDSFSDGGSFISSRDAVAHGRRLIEHGADLIDLGGESTRPGAEPIPAATEISRVMPVLEDLSGTVPISVDTTKPEVARLALEAGAEVINDVTAGSDPALLEQVAAAGAGLILMHMQGSPGTMQDDPRYEDVVQEIKLFLTERSRAAQQAGVQPDQIAIDPGIGFGKTLEHNLDLIREIGSLRGLGFPVVLGASRKKFLGTIIGVDQPSQRDLASAVVAALAVERGADVLRVHNVSACREAVAVALAIVRGSGG